MNAAIPEHKPMAEEISGLIERVTFHNDESGFCVLRVRTRGHRDETTVIGSLPSVTAGEWLVAEGWWVRDKEHGLQFKARSLKTVPPTTVEGIERYLGGGSVKGIGPILAKKLVERFGAEVLGVIENRATELELVDGIGPKRRERIAHAWQEAKQVREEWLIISKVRGSCFYWGVTENGPIPDSIATACGQTNILIGDMDKVADPQVTQVALWITPASRNFARVIRIHVDRMRLGGVYHRSALEAHVSWGTQWRIGYPAISRVFPVHRWTRSDERWSSRRRSLFG